MKLRPVPQRLFAIAWLTIQAALRLRVVLALAVLLVVCALLLPFFIKHNGTARMFSQVLLTYSLYLCTGLLGIATVWIACGTHATDVDAGQLQLLAVKPAARWQIWLGRWLGVMTLNAVLLAIAGACAWAMLHWQARQLDPEQREILAREVLVARGSAREAAPDIQGDVERIIARRQQEGTIAGLDLSLVRRELLDQARARQESVAPNYRRIWEVDLGRHSKHLADAPLHLRVRFHAAAIEEEEATYNTVWVIGKPESGRFIRLPQPLSTGVFQEFAIPAGLIGADGRLHIECENRDRSTLLFPLSDGLEVLFPEGSFLGNYIRALLVVVCWLGLLASVGLAAASCLSFIVAALFAMALLLTAMSGETFASVLHDGTVLGVDHETGLAHNRALDGLALPIYRLLHGLTDSLTSISPIEALSEGRTITWPRLAQTALRILLFAGAMAAAPGIIVFTRRELADDPVGS